MTLRLTFAAVAMIMSNMAFSAVTITAPEEIKILAVNDQEVNTGLVRSATNSYKLDAGENSISVRYVEFFEHLNGEHDIVKSGVVTLTTPALQNDQTYKLNLVNAPKGYEAAKKYAEQPIIALYDAQNKLLVEQVGANTEQKPWLSRGLFGTAIDLTQKKTKPQNQPAPTYVAEPVVKPTVVVTSSKIVDSADNTSSDQKLIQIWQKASKAERQKFMSWLAEQAN